MTGAPVWTFLIGALLAGAFLGLRTYAVWIERRALDTSEKVHRLRRMSGLTILLLLMAIMVVASASGLAELLFRTFPPNRRPLVYWGSYLGLFVVCAALSYLAIHRSYARIRQLQMTPQQGLRRALAWLGLMLLPLGVWILILTFLPDDVADNPLLRWGMFAVFLLAIAAVSPVLVMRVLGSSLPSQELHEHVLDLCRRHAVDIRDVRIIQGRAEKHANALFSGVLPGFRYVFLTDHLVEQMAREELDAVLAHEIGHGKEHHLLIKVGSAVVLFGLLLGGAALAGAELGGAVGFRIALLVALLLIMLCFPLIQGAIGVALERRADDYAARTAGLDPTVRALDKLAELNAVRRRTGFLWNLLQQHPGAQQRIDRLRARQGAPA